MHFSKGWPTACGMQTRGFPRRLSCWLKAENQKRVEYIDAELPLLRSALSAKAVKLLAARRFRKRDRRVMMSFGLKTGMSRCHPI